MRTGKLEAFFETGTEGVVWSTYEDGKQGYDALCCLQDGDYLKVISPEGAVVFDGEVNLEWERNFRQYPMNPSLGQQEVDGFWVRGLQVGVDPQDWSKWFHGQYRCEFDILPRERLDIRAYPSSNAGIEAAVNAALDTLVERFEHEGIPAVLQDLSNHWEWDTATIHPLFANGLGITVPTRLMDRVRTVASQCGLLENVLLEQLVSRYIPTYDMTYTEE